MMNSDEKLLRAMLQEAQQQADGSPPSFETVFAAAKHALIGRRRMQAAGLVAAIAMMAIALGLLSTGGNEITYVDLDELVATTNWSAPSDSLLPTHQFDLYREMPRLFESTDTDEGATL